MAAQTTPQTYSNEDVNLTRLSCIHHKVATRVLRTIFKYGSSSRPHHMLLLDFYSSEGINIKKFENRLFGDQKRKIAVDPEGASFDITLLYRCLRTGSHGLAKGNDEKWDKKDKASIESLITIVKDKRNHLAHDRPKYSNRQLIDETNDLKQDLIQILEFSRHIYSILTTQIDQEISDVEFDIMKYLNDAFEPKTFEEYKNQLFFDAQTEFLNDEGLKDTLEYYDKCFEDEVSNTNHLVDLNLPVDNVYTDMALKGESGYDHDRAIVYEDVLLDELHNITDFVIVVNGPAGVGKTTFTKRMIRDFRSKMSIMKFLATYDHLLKAECRNTAVKSFIQMLQHLMPKASELFKAEDLKIVILAQKVLVILDGLDELNATSAQLFEELLCLKKTYGITLMITTRPEKMKYVEERLKSYQLKMKHIHLLGIPPERRDELVTKYSSEISKKYSITPDIHGLLKYLKETEHRLADLWRLPYNLTLVTILWMYNFMNVTSINTAPELYREILTLYRTKLKERLQSSESTRHLQDSELQRKMDFFLYSLAREALIGLINDQINISREAYKRLENVCINIKIPVEELIGAFLKRVPSAEIIYSLPHKGLQDYLAAYFIFMNISSKAQELDFQDTMERVTEFFIQTNVPQIRSENIVRLVEGELKKSTRRGMLVRTAAAAFGGLFPSLRASSLIHTILKDLHNSSKYELTKFQNVFICLLGMFYSEKEVIEEDIKLEALNLLQGTGIRDRDAWITILNSVKCDEYVASFISKQPKILDGHIQITDSSVSAYVSLMQALKPPLKNAHKVKVDVDIKEDLTGCPELLQLISSHHFKVMQILVNSINVQDHVAMLKDLKTPLKDAHNVNIDICDIEEQSDFWELINLIKKNNFTVRILRVRYFEINDANLGLFISVFKSLPRLLEDANQTCLDINIKGDLEDAKELLGLISTHQFKVKRFLLNDTNFVMYATLLKTMTKSLKEVHKVKVEICIDEDIADIRDLMREIKLRNFDIEKFKVKDIQITIENFKKYTDILKELPPSLKDAHKVNIDLQVKKELPEIKELVKLISDKGFTIRTLKLKDETMGINENNLPIYTESLGSLPLLKKDAYKGDISIDIRKYNPEVSSVLKEIARNKFAVKLCLYHDFRYPESLSSEQEEEVLNSVFERCPVKVYVGRMSPQLSMPVSLKELGVSVPDALSYLQLRRFLKEKHQLKWLYVSINLDIEIEEIIPLPGETYPKLFLPDIRTEEYVRKASEITKRLIPIDGQRMFEHIFFPRLRLEGMDALKSLLSRLTDVKVLFSIVIPTSYRPSSGYRENILRLVAKKDLNCGIIWGKPSRMSVGSIYDLNSWE